MVKASWPTPGTARMYSPADIFLERSSTRSSTVVPARSAMTFPGRRVDPSLAWTITAVVTVAAYQTYGARKIQGALQ